MHGLFSDVRIYGEQRGAALADFNRDGRVDFAVTQNAAETRVFQNQSGKPGIRVRLKGPPGNPEGIGASIRLKSESEWGPAREVQAGSGYWSQNSAIQIMHSPQPPSVVEVTWPGRLKTQKSLSNPSGNVAIAFPANPE